MTPRRPRPTPPSEIHAARLTAVVGAAETPACAAAWSAFHAALGHLRTANEAGFAKAVDRYDKADDDVDAECHGHPRRRRDGPAAPANAIRPRRKPAPW